MSGDEGGPIRRHVPRIAATAGAVVASSAPAHAQTSAATPVRLGFVGIGGRGSYHLDCALGIEGIEVPALCEIQPDRLERAAGWVEQSGRPAPRLYGRGERDFERLCEEEDLDCVICVTSWRWHAPVCLAANRHGKHAVSEVPIVLTVEEAWSLVEAFEQTGKWSTLALEQVLLEVGGGMYLTLLNMIRQGVLGDVLHAESGYVHDLRRVKFPGGSEPWRLQHAIDRNGNLYPDHPMNRIMPAMDINHGDRFAQLVSVSSRAVTLNEYAASRYGREHPLASRQMAQGDYNATLIRTADGKLVTLNFDTNTPHPREFTRIQGTNGVFFDGRGMGGPKIYLDGVSSESHRWEDAARYMQDYRHPLLDSFDPPGRPALRGHGGQSTKTPLTWHLLVEALRAGTAPYFDVYDSVTSSVISPLSEQSVARGSRPVDFPDFTRGRWRTRPPIQFA
ncbi:MAG: Gfo/Idh/MocA family oxidoreductase [Bryobacterales bacterium]|nr:Gfo/Idh/MocA family oxidoreductase [Bryobacterales bacterium]